jgi:hypothetical protein
MIIIPDNPLAQALSEDEGNGISDECILMEYMKNGTLNSFIAKARRRNEPLPNRLVWRLFGCRE